MIALEGKAEMGKNADEIESMEEEYGSMQEEVRTDEGVGQ